jgi:hypothetical protein
MSRSNDELLRLASRAVNGGVWHEQTHAKPWNPLTDDGDALRLAVALGLRLTLPKYKGFGTSAEPQNGSTAGCTAFRDDPMEQTREAIVRAAAEIGAAS